MQRKGSVVSRFREIWHDSGALLAVCRIFKRLTSRILEQAMNRVWRSSLADFGQSSRIQRGVAIERPRSVRIGRNCLLSQGVQITSEFTAGQLVLGDYVQVNTDVHVDHTGNLTIGEGALISEGSLLLTHSHGHDPRSQPEPTDLTIGKNVWIGAHVLVMSGVTTIGDDSIVAAGAVVTRPVPPRTLVAGNPARVIKSLSGRVVP